MIRTTIHPAPLKRRGFTFVGPVTMYALMQAIGIVNDHPEESPRRAACSMPSAPTGGRCGRA